VTSDGGLVYARAQAQVSAYLPLDADEDTVAAGRPQARVHRRRPVGGGPGLRPLLPGGGGSVRGYGYQAVGPRYSDGLPQGGLSLFEASAEMRHNFGLFGAGGLRRRRIGGDLGQSGLQDVRFAVGLGLRYNLPFAPCARRRPALHRPQGDAPFQVYVSIGQSF